MSFRAFPMSFRSAARNLHPFAKRTFSLPLSEGELKGVPAQRTQGMSRHSGESGWDAHPDKLGGEITAHHSNH